MRRSHQRSHDFEDELKAEDNEIAWLCQTPAFVVKKAKTPEEQSKPPPYWNAWNLIPCEREGYGPYTSAAWRVRMQCYQAAGGSAGEYERLMDGSYVEVVQILLLQRAANY